MLIPLPLIVICLISLKPAFDKFGPETDTILKNWLTAVEANVLAALNKDPSVVYNLLMIFKL
jgi:hypothetical protein